MRTPDGIDELVWVRHLLDSLVVARFDAPLSPADVARYAELSGVEQHLLRER